MPTKRLTILDVTGADSHTTTGNIEYHSMVGGILQGVEIPFSGAISEENYGSFTISFDQDSVTETYETLPGPVHTPANSGVFLSQPGAPADDATHTSVFTLDYEIGVPVFGIPTDAKIKKLVYNSGWNYIVSYNIDAPLGALGLGGSQVFRLKREIEIGPYTELVQFPLIIASYPTNLSSTNEHINNEADHVLFDYTEDDETWITTEDLVTDYSVFLNRIHFRHTGGVGEIPAYSMFYLRAQYMTGLSPVGSVITVNAILVAHILPGWYVDVTYELAGFSWQLDDPPPTRAIQPGDIITYTSNPEDENSMDFTEITSIEINGTPIPIGNWIDIQPHLLQFVLPEFETEGPDHTGTPTVTSTQFDGTVPLQTVPTINFENAPGIYTFVDGETHDTYYNRISSIEGTEIETKIPNPTGRTGFY